MNTHGVFARRSGAGLLALLAAVLTPQALAANEVVALASHAVVIEIEARPSSLQAELNEYVRCVHAQMKAKLEDGFKQRPAPALALVGIENSTRS